MPPMQPTPISSYEFENNVLDSTGTNDGTVTGNTQFTTGKVGNNAFDFDGSSFITLANEGNFDFEHSDAFSIAFWVKPVSTTSNNDMILAKGTAIAKAGYYVRYLTTNDQIQFILSDGTANFIRNSGNNAAPIDSWTHVVITYAGNSNRDGIKIYINGSLDTTGTPRTMSTSILNNESLTIGAESDGGKVFDGQLDDVMIYDLELTAEKVAILAGI